MPNKQTRAIARCGAKCRDGSKCTQYPIKGGNGRCRMHNGHAKRGIEASRYEGKGYSEYMPFDMVGNYKASQSNEHLLTLRDEIALSDAMLMAMLPNLETGESGEAWKQSSKLLNQLERDYQNSDAAGMAQGLRAMRAIAGKQIAHYRAAEAVNKQAEHRRKLVETELRISLQGESAISIEMFTLTMQAVYQLVELCFREHKNERIEFAKQLRELVTIDSGR